MKKPVKIAIYVILGLFVVIQFYPDGIPRENPAVETVIEWPDQQAKDLFYAACADCHSNETKWPWYSYVAPAKWIVKNHVVDGRKKFNISAQGFGKDEHEAGEVIREDYMPMQGYTLLHSEANLNPDQKELLASTLEKMFGKEEH